MVGDGKFCVSRVTGTASRPRNFSIGGHSTGTSKTDVLIRCSHAKSLSAFHGSSLLISSRRPSSAEPSFGIIMFLIGTKMAVQFGSPSCKANFASEA
jgi:hypothetical protein